MRILRKDDEVTTLGSPPQKGIPEYEKNVSHMADSYTLSPFPLMIFSFVHPHPLPPPLSLCLPSCVHFSPVYFSVSTSSASLSLPSFVSSTRLLSFPRTSSNVPPPVLCHNIAWTFTVSIFGFPVVIF